MRSINTEVSALGDSLSWDTNQCVSDITTIISQIILLTLLQFVFHLYPKLGSQMDSFPLLLVHSFKTYFERRIFFSLQNCHFSSCISKNLNILMYKTHPFFWCQTLGQKSVSYIQDSMVQQFCTKVGQFLLFWLAFWVASLPGGVRIMKRSHDWRLVTWPKWMLWSGICYPFSNSKLFTNSLRSHLVGDLPWPIQGLWKL